MAYSCLVQSVLSISATLVHSFLGKYLDHLLSAKYCSGLLRCSDDGEDGGLLGVHILARETDNFLEDKDSA